MATFTKLCFGQCTKEIYDAKNPQLTPPVVKDHDHCPDLTQAEITQVLNAAVAAGKQENITSHCVGKDCTCGDWGPQPPFGNYTPLKFEATYEKHATFGDPPKDHTCVYTVKGTIDTAKVSVPGSCKPGPNFVLKVKIP